MCTYLSPPRNGVYYFRRGIPQHLRLLLGKTEFLISLRTKDKAEAKRLLPQYVITSEKELADAQRAANSMVQSADVGGQAQAAAVWRQWQKREQALWEHDQAGAAHFEQEDAARAERQAARAELRTRLEQRLMLTTAELSPEEAAFKDMLADETFDRVIAQERLIAYKGTLRKVAKTRDISLLANPFASQPREKAKVSVMAMFEAFGRQDGLRSATVRQFAAVMRHFVDFIGHDDATQVTTQDIIRWRLHLVSEVSSTGKPRAASTINGSYLAAVSVTFAHGFNALQIPSNPMIGVASARAQKVVKLREKDFTLAERATILTATLQPITERLAAEHVLARRWVPWLCAYTGARVNEITQLRGEDVTQIDGIWSIKVTPEAGNVKTDAARFVPLHEHLVEQGFPAVALAKGKGPIFYRADNGRGGDTDRAPYKRMGMRLAAWVRSLGITDTALMPNHAWRHTFKTICFEVGIEERATDYMQGHASKGVGRNYGSNTLPALAKQLEKFPRFPVDTEATSG